MGKIPNLKLGSSLALVASKDKPTLLYSPAIGASWPFTARVPAAGGVHFHLEPERSTQSEMETHPSRFCLLSSIICAMIYRLEEVI
jgi:hypothetical protein